MMHKSDVRQSEKTIVHVDAEIKEIVPIFLENRHKDIQSMVKALEQHDYEAVRILGHSMKGSGGGYGFDAISDIGRWLEQAAKDKDSYRIRELVSTLSEYLECVEIIYE